jgi:hypothetical protein
MEAVWRTHLLPKLIESITLHLVHRTKSNIYVNTRYQDWFK